VAVQDDVAPWEDEMPWTDLGQATPQPHRTTTPKTPAHAKVDGAVAARGDDAALLGALAAQAAQAAKAAQLARQAQALREQAARDAADAAARQEEARAHEQQHAREQQARLAEARATQLRAEQEREAQLRDAAQREAAAQLVARREAQAAEAAAREAQAIRDAAQRDAALRDKVQREAVRRQDAAREQAVRDAQADAEREQAARARAAMLAAEREARKATKATPIDPPRFEQGRRAAQPAEPLLRDAAARQGAGAPLTTNPVDQALAQALDLRLMRLASRTLVALALLALLGWGLLWLARGPWFAFKHLTVQGQLHHNNIEALRSEVLPQLHGGYFTLDLQAARAVLEATPWVRRAQVKRVWPDRLVVRLEEHQPKAVWEHEDEEDQLVNIQGEIFDGNAADLDDSVAHALPVLHGPSGSAPQMLAMHARLAPVFARLQADLNKLELSERGSWRATLANRSVIELGRGEPSEVEERTRRFVATVGEVSARFGRRAVESADLRHQDGYALKLVGMGTTAKPASTGKGR
jgi:cell division protein FtsQ